MSFAKKEKVRVVRRELRLTHSENDQIRYEAMMAGVTVSELIRRRVMGGRPIQPKVELKMINELRRLGGLQKMLCEKRLGNHEKYFELLDDIQQAIKRIATQPKAEG